MRIFAVMDPVKDVKDAEKMVELYLKKTPQFQRKKNKRKKRKKLFDPMDIYGTNAISFR